MHRIFVETQIQLVLVCLLQYIKILNYETLSPTLSIDCNEGSGRISTQEKEPLSIRSLPEEEASGFEYPTKDLLRNPCISVFTSKRTGDGPPKALTNLIEALAYT